MLRDCGMTDLPQDIIGRQKDGDYDLAPGVHAKIYGDQAPALASALRDSSLLISAKQFDEHNRRSVRAQALYKSWMFQGSIGVFVTGVLGAAMMASELLVKEGEMWPATPTVLSLFAGAAGAYACYCLYRLREGKLLETWMSE